MWERFVALLRLLGIALRGWINTTRRFVMLLIVVGLIVSGFLYLLVNSPFIFLNILLMIPAGLLAGALETSALAHVDIFFTLMREGTHGVIMRGDSIDHVILRHLGYWINDPRRTDPDDPQHFDSKKPKWERIRGEPGEFYSSYPPNQRIRRSLEGLGIYYYGFWPFKRRYTHSFGWVETQISKESRKEEFWPRQQRTNFAYSAMFTYAILLEGAETKNNIPVNARYLLSVEVNNAAIALFDVEDWLTRITADSNTKAKMLFARKEFEQLTREGELSNEQKTQIQSEFVDAIMSLNKGLIDEKAAPKGKTSRGAPRKIGITIVGVSLQQVEPGGPDFEALGKALTAEVVAKHTAKGVVAKAWGDAEAVTIAADAEQKAIGVVYTEIGKHEHGVAVRTLQALERSGEKGGNTVWAPNPFDGLAKSLEHITNRLPKPQSDGRK